MDFKKTIIFSFAIIAIAIAIISIFNLQKESSNQPIRQEKEIR